jgi:hypothetical protein
MKRFALRIYKPGEKTPSKVITTATGLKMLNEETLDFEFDGMKDFDGFDFALFDVEKQKDVLKGKLTYKEPARIIELPRTETQTC